MPRKFAAHVTLNDGTRYGVLETTRNQTTTETLYRDPPKVNGRDRKRNRKAARRRLRGKDAR